MKKRVWAILALFALLAAACDVDDLITSPDDGSVVDAATVVVSGVVGPDYEAGGTLTVNGIPTAVAPDGTWTQTVPTVVGITTPIEALYTEPTSGDSFRHRQAVINGPSLPAGAASADGVGLVFSAAGLSGLGPVVQELAGGAFDIGALLQSQNPIIENEPLFLTFQADGNVYEAGIGGVTLDAVPAVGGIATTIGIDDLYVGLDLAITDNLAINISCGLELQIDTVTIDGIFDLEPDAVSPSSVDVIQVGDLTIDLGTVSHEFISGICDGDTFAIGGIVAALTPDLETLIADGFETNLGDPDGAGPLDGPIADSIETALGGIDIAGEVAGAVGVNLDAPFNSIVESATGIVMEADADFFTTVGTGPGDCQPDLGDPVLGETFDVPGSFPAIGATTPGGDPFDLGLVISASAFNQLLGSMAECGFISADISEFDFGAGLEPLTLHGLIGLVPEFAVVADVPATIQVRPTSGPFMTDSAGPNGETAELVMGNLLITIVGHYNGFDFPWLTLAVDAPLGLELAYDAPNNVLQPTVTAGPAGSVVARTTLNNINANEATLEAVFPLLFPLFADQLGNAFGAFPLPSFLGLGIDVVEVARQGTSFVLYADLTVVPKTRIENVVLNDVSSGDTVVDSIFDVKEWRHRLRPTISSTSVDVDFKGMIGADACCTVEDEEITAHAGYDLSFDVVPENGESWQLAIDHSILGAHTLYDEKVALEDAGGRTVFQTPIAARVKVGAGPWQSFDFLPSPDRIVHDLYGGEGDTYAPFTGSNSIVLNGTTAETILVEFDWDMKAKSNSNAFFPAAGGDEVAIRFGANDTITNGFTAGGYPGTGNRSLTDDGHKLSVALTAS